jgi:two-component system, NtrC family, response regulator AtoC
VNFDLAPSSMTPVAAPKAQPQAIPNGSTLQFAIGTPLDVIEREVIVATLEHCRGHKRETAELLGVSLKTLYNRLNEYRAPQAAVAGGPGTASALSM